MQKPRDQNLFCRMMLVLAAVLFAASLLVSSCSAEPAEAKLVLINDAVSEGAVCLDGTAPGYYFRPGTGSGINSWIVHMEGGGVCSTEEECLSRSKTNLGSSKNWPPTQTGDGFLSANNNTNPGFSNWNVAYLMYCDGSSFAGYLHDPLNINGTKVYIRGTAILKANIRALLDQGMMNAERVILTGCSAGGIGTYIHADSVKTMLPSTIKYHAMADAGYFIDAPNVHGVNVFRELVQRTLLLHNSTDTANEQCTQDYSDELWKCGVAQYLYKYITTPMFTLNSAWDTWQLSNILELDCHPEECPPDRKKQFENYGQEFLSAVAPVRESKTNGMFVDSCLVHCQSLNAHYWSEVKVGGKSAVETFSSWYFNDGGEIKQVDCDRYPCNPTC